MSEEQTHYAGDGCRPAHAAIAGETTPTGGASVPVGVLRAHHWDRYFAKCSCGWRAHMRFEFDECVVVMEAYGQYISHCLAVAEGRND